MENSIAQQLVKMQVKILEKIQEEGLGNIGETAEALREPALRTVEEIQNVLEKTPPELASDVYERGIVMSGGGSLLFGLDELLREKTGIGVIMADDPLTVVCIGTGKYMEMNLH